MVSAKGRLEKRTGGGNGGTAALLLYPHVTETALPASRLGL